MLDRLFYMLYKFDSIINYLLLLFLAIILFVFTFSLSGCATTNKAIEVFRTGHDQIQEMVDTTQAFCQHSRALLIERNMDTAVLETYCEKAWEQFKTYKKITDIILEE